MAEAGTTTKCSNTWQCMIVEMNNGKSSSSDFMVVEKRKNPCNEKPLKMHSLD